MNTQRALIAAAELLDFEAGQIVTARLVSGSLVVLIDRGIGGIPKYTIPLSDLEKPEPAAEPSEQPALDPSEMTVAEIKALDLSAAKWQQLLEMERAGKARQTAIDHIESELE